MKKTVLPYWCEGTVITGFGRGSRQLGIPTANLDEQVVSDLPSDLDNGVYYGWASVDRGAVHKAVASVGWNPQFHSQKKTLEVHLMHNFTDDFHGAHLQVVLCGFLRPMREFDTVEKLVDEIHNDIRLARENLDKPDFAKLTRSGFFRPVENGDGSDAKL